MKGYRQFLLILTSIKYISFPIILKNVFLVNEDFLYCTRNHGGLAYGYLSDFTVNTHGCRYLVGSQVRNTMILANPMFIELVSHRVPDCEASF